MGPTKGPVPPADESRRREEKMAGVEKNRQREIITL